MPKSHSWGISHAGDAEQESYEIHYDEPAQPVDEPAQAVDEPVDEESDEQRSHADDDRKRDVPRAGQRDAKRDGRGSQR